MMTLWHYSACECAALHPVTLHFHGHGEDAVCPDGALTLTRDTSCTAAGMRCSARELLSASAASTSSLSSCSFISSSARYLRAVRVHCVWDSKSR